MRFLRVWCVLPMALALFTLPAPLSAAEPEKIGVPFEATITPGQGGPQVDMTFSLTLSDVSTYPVTITAIAGSTEEELWKGSLPEGVYRFKAQLHEVKSGPVRLVLKAKMTNLQAGGNQTYYSYRRWDGTIR